MRRLRLILGALAVLLVAALVAGYAALVSLDLESYRSTIEQRAEAATGRKLTLDGPMDLKVDFSPAIAVEGVSFANAGWGTRSDMATVGRFELEVALLPLLTGDIQVRRLVLVEPRILLETDDRGQGNWVLAPDGAAAGDGGGSGMGWQATVQSVRIENGRLTYRDGQTGVDLQLALQQATLRRDGDGHLQVDAQGGYQTVPFELTGTVGQFAQLASGGGRYPVDLTLTAANATARLQGALDQTAPDLRPDLEVTVEGRRLADLNPLLGAKLPDVGPFRLTTRVRGEAKGYVLSGLQAKLADSDLSGEATLRVTGARPALSGEFTAARIDLPQLTGGDGSDAEEAGEARLFPDTPLPLELLGALDADVKLDVGALRLAEGATANEVELTLSLADGKLQVQPLQGQFAGGRFRAGLDVDSAASPPKVGVKASAETLRYGRLLRDLGVTDQAEGTLDASADLTGAGRTPHAIAGSLRGQIEVIGEEGRFAHQLLEGTSAGLGQVLAPWTDDADGMQLNCLVGRFQVADGIAESQAILADTKDVTLVGDGSIDLGEERYDLRLMPEAKHTSLASLAVPMRVTGPLTAPQIGPDPMGAAKAGAIAIGSLVNPLVTLGALVAESELSEQNPCVEALREATREGGGDGGASNGLGGFLKGLGDSIDKQLGVEGE